MAKHTWRSAGLTHRGLVRSDNQDNFYISEDGRVFAVADGVGGHRGGETASRLAVNTIDELWRLNASLEDDKIEQWMHETAAEANRRIVDAARQDAALDNMGTTIVFVVLDKDGNLHVGHAGDSRAMLFRHDELKVLTIDHSVVMEMHLRGQLTHEQCRTNIFKHLITRCLGHDGHVDIDYAKFETLSGDYVILASDGLVDEMIEEEVGAVISRCNAPQDVCDKLLEDVLKRGARDNVTIVTMHAESTNVETNAHDLRPNFLQTSKQFGSIDSAPNI